MSNPQFNYSGLWCSLKSQQHALNRVLDSTVSALTQLDIERLRDVYGFLNFQLFPKPSDSMPELLILSPANLPFEHSFFQTAMLKKNLARICQ